MRLSRARIAAAISLNAGPRPLRTWTTKSISLGGSPMIESSSEMLRMVFKNSRTELEPRVVAVSRSLRLITLDLDRFA